MKNVDRWAYLFAVLAALALAAFSTGCATGDDDDNDDNAPVDDDSVDDDSQDDDSQDDDVQDDDAVDDDSTPDDSYINVDPWAEMLPAGTTQAFTAAGQIDGEAVSTGFTWSIEDTGIATVDENGLVTAVAAGVTTLTAAIGDVAGEATVLVGPDVYVIDVVTGFLMGIDRGNQTAIADLLGGGAIGTVLYDVKNADGRLLIVDSGDSAPGISGNEKLLVVDLFDYSLETVPLEQDSPWAVTAFNGYYWVTGNLDDTLAKIDAETDSRATIYYDLDAGCTPTDVIGVGNYLYVACSGFSWDFFEYAPGKALVINPENGAKVTEIALPVNPFRFGLAPNGEDLYIVCTGDYDYNSGTIAQICTKENVVKDSFALGQAPGQIGINPEGLAFVAEGMAGNVYVFDTAGNIVLRGTDDPIVIPDAAWIQAVGAHSNTGDAYVCDSSNGQVYVLNATSYSEIFHVSLSNPGGVAFW